MLLQVNTGRRFQAFALATLVVLSLQAEGSGNPGDQDPRAALAIHDLSGSKDLWSQASGLCDKAFEDMQGIAASQGKASAKQLAEAHVGLRRLQRLAGDLQINGETAGVDFSLRARAMQDQLAAAITAFTGNPANATQIAKIRQALYAPRLQQKVKTALERTQKFQREEKWLEAYSLLEDTFDEVTSYTTFLSAQEGEQALRIYGQLVQEIMPRRNTLLREQAMAKLEEAGAPIVPDTQGFLASVTAAATALQSQSTASIDGESL
ncbi:MAG: hypothetical protein JJ992_13670, partial [Planctomycetes bacterium]|nr:hypothetical protein [Planctomycetota bacterium]